MLNRFIKLTVISVIAFSSAVFAQSTDKIVLPDLGTPEANAISIQPNVNAQGAGFNYRDNLNGKILSVSPQYNRQNGSAIGGSLASPFGKNMATGILLMSGEDRNEWMLNAGIDFYSHHRLIFSLGQLRQNLNFNFTSGAEKTKITQDNIAASYQYLLGKDWLNAVELNAYASDTGSVKLSDKTFFTDTGSFYELWNDPRRIAGGRVTGSQGRLVFTPTTKTTIKFGLGAERLTYDHEMGNESTTRAAGSAELLQRLDHDFNFRASVNAAASQSIYAIGLGKSLKDGVQLGIDIANIRGRDKTYNDTQLRLTFTQSFGGGHTSASANNTSALRNVDATSATLNQAYNNTPAASTAGNAWKSSLVEQVSRRPSFLPSQVVAKVDSTSTPVRLIAIDKAATPAGSTVSPETGIYTAPTVTPVGGISSVTLNGSAFTNSGQFALSGNNLIINPKLITPPAVGIIDTYVVTMSNATGGGTTLATVKVSNGSIKIDSIVIGSGTLIIGAAISGVTAPVGGAAPVTSVSGTGYTGAVTWSPTVTGTFAYNTVYTATVTLTPATGYTASGVTSNFFTVSGATATNAANSGVVSALFPATTAAGFFTVSGVTSTPPSAGGYVNYAAAVNYCSSLTTSGKTWRLPTYSELTALNNSLVSAGYDNRQPPGWPSLSQTWSSTSNGSGGYRTMYMPYSTTDTSTSRSPSELAVTLCVTTG